MLNVGLMVAAFRCAGKLHFWPADTRPLDRGGGQRQSGGSPATVLEFMIAAYTIVAPSAEPAHKWKSWPAFTTTNSRLCTMI
jgi:hypothetical protein